MSTNLGSKQPKNFLTYTSGDTFLTAEFKSSKVRVDKKTVTDAYTARWTLSAVVDDKPKLIGCLDSPVDATTRDEALDRMDYLSDFVAGVIESAANSDAKDEVLAKIKPREIVAATHAKWHSIALNGEDFTKTASVLVEFIKEFEIKNVKKVLAAVLDAKIEHVKESPVGI
jgi:hypothetical protein